QRGTHAVARQCRGAHAVHVSAHAVGDQEQSEAGVGAIGVFVDGAPEAGVRSVSEFDHGGQAVWIGGSMPQSVMLVTVHAGCRFMSPRGRTEARVILLAMAAAHP